jgi:uncharacterized delta-60 repeat protein
MPPVYRLLSTVYYFLGEPIVKIILTFNPATPSPKQVWRNALMLALLTLLCWSFPVAQAAPGDVDTSFAGFGNNGVVTHTGVAMSWTFEQSGPAFQYQEGMALQPNGNIVMVGYHTNLLLISRYLPNGQPDRTFDGDGTAPIHPPLGIRIRATDVAVQADGKIVVAGRNTVSINDASSDFLLLRLTSTGALDESFGNGGYVLTGFGNHRDCAIKVLIQPDGKIVAAGLTYNGDDDDFAVARYMPDGKPDNTFDGEGKVTIGFGGDDQAYDMALLNDGRLVVVGGNGDFVVASLNPNGTPDETFGGGDGKLTTDFGDHETATAVVVQADGRIVVLGNNSDDHKSHIARYMPNGKPDNSLNGNGKLTIPVDVLNDLALLPDGKMMVLGYSPGAADDDTFAFRRLNANGSPDMSFNNGGVLWLDFDTASDRGTDIALLPDGRILGFGGSGSSGIYDKLRLVRLWPDGTFDTGGQQAHSLTFAPTYRAGYLERAYDMALQADGSFLVAGQVYNPQTTVSDAFVTRFKANGLPDTSFGTNGSAFIFAPGLFRAAKAVAVQPDGKIVIAGYAAYNAQYTAMDFLVARFLPTGGIDSSFGTGGVTLVDFFGGADAATALALAPDGKIVVAGSIQGARSIWGVARLTGSGQPDNSFGGNGQAYVDFNGDNGVNAVVVQPDGRIILGGYFKGDFALHRLLDNGPSDPSFGPQGTGYTSTNLGGTDIINALALAPNGFIYAGGVREVGGDQDFALMQYQSNGLKATCAPDAPCTNWPSGRYVSGLGGDDSINALALRADGQLVAAGCSEGHFGGVQVRTDGDPVPTQLLFNTDFVGSPDCAKGVKFVGANQILMAGDQNLPPYGSGDNNMALARFETTVNTGPNPTPNPNPTRGPVYLPIILR